MFWVVDWVKYITQPGCETSLLSQGVKKGAKNKRKIRAVDLFRRKNINLF